MRWAPWAMLAAILHTPAAALALGASLGNAESPPVVAARVAISVGGSEVTEWMQVRFAQNTGSFAWLLPVPAASRVAEGGGGLLEALEATSAPGFADGGRRGCEGTAEGRLRASSSAFLSSSDEFADWTSSWGFAVAGDLRSRIDALLQNGEKLLALAYAPSTSAVWTEAIQVSGTPSPRIPLLLTRASRAPVLVTAFVLAGAFARIGNESLLGGETVQFRAGVPAGARPWWEGDEYCAARDRLLLQEDGARWLLEYAGPDRIGAAQKGTTGADEPLAEGGVVQAPAVITRAVGMVAPFQYGADWEVTLDPEKSPPVVRIPSVELRHGPIRTASQTIGTGIASSRASASMPSDGGVPAQPAGDASTNIPAIDASRPPAVAAPPQVSSPVITPVVVEEPTSESGETQDSCSCSGAVPTSTSTSDTSDSEESDSCSGSSQPDSGSDSSGCDSTTDEERESDSSGCDRSTDSEDSDPAGECAVAQGRARHRHAFLRIRISQLLVGVAALLLPIRRRARKRERRTPWRRETGCANRIG